MAFTKKWGDYNNKIMIDELLLLQSVCSRPSKQMEYPEEHYYKLNRFLLSVIGLCPYQTKRKAYLMRAIFTVVMLSSILVQNLSVLTSEVTMDYTVNLIPTYFLVAGNLINLHARILHVDKFRELFERMSKDWALKKTHVEIKIMHKYAETSRLYTLYFLILAYINIGGYTIWIFIPEIVNIMSFMNISLPRKQPFHLEYLIIDPERYFYFIRLHICLVLYLMPVTYIACFSLFMTLMQHVCGMCELLGNRAERLFYVVKNKAVCNLIQESQINSGNIAVFMRQHYSVIQFVDIIETCHTVPFLIELLGAVIFISLTLIQIITISDTEQAIRSIALCIAVLTYLFILSYMGQRITDMSLDVCEKIFNSMWYSAGVLEQKALLIMMARCCRPFILTAFKFYVISLRNFGMILQTAVSYCTCIRQF